MLTVPLVNAIGIQYGDFRHSEFQLNHHIAYHIAADSSWKAFFMVDVNEGIVCTNDNNVLISPASAGANRGFDRKKMEREVGEERKFGV